jgi:hypothetical protein
MIAAIRRGFDAVSRNRGLVALVWAVNVATAAILAVPLAALLERDLRNTELAANMMYSFDYGWWSAWHDGQKGWTASFAPDIVGTGFAFKNLDLLLRGELPAGLFAARPDDDEEQAGGTGLDPVILGLGVFYLVVQTFLAGGLLGVFRSPHGGWTVRGLLHGGGFYFGRLLRVAALGLLAFGFVFALARPFDRWVDDRAVAAVSESTALAWSLSRYALLFAALAFVHMLSSYAKVIVAVEERSSAVLAWVSAFGFCLANLRRTVAPYAVVGLAALLLLLVWRTLDASVPTVGYRTQVLTLAFGQAFVLGRIALRLWLLASQVALYRS